MPDHSLHVHSWFGTAVWKVQSSLIFSLIPVPSCLCIEGQVLQTSKHSIQEQLQFVHCARIYAWFLLYASIGILNDSWP